MSSVLNINRRDIAKSQADNSYSKSIIQGKENVIKTILVF